MILSKLQSNAAPCQPFGVMLKWFKAENGGVRKYAFPHPHPNSANINKLFAKQEQKQAIWSEEGVQSDQMEPKEYPMASKWS